MSLEEEIRTWIQLREDHVGKAAIYKPSREAPEESDSADTLVSDTPSLQGWEKMYHVI